MKLKLVISLGILISGLMVNVAQGQDDTTSKYGKDSTKCIINNSLYYEFYRQWKQSDYSNEAWKDAVKPWRWVFLNCPRSTINIYLHGENIVEELIKTETDKEKKEKYIDTLMMVYDQRIKYYGKEGYVLYKKGVALYKYRPEAYEQVYNILKKSIEMEGNDSDGPALIYYFRSAEKLVKDGKIDTTVLVDIYDKSSEIIDFNLNKYTTAGDSTRVTYWENIRGNIELSFEPYATCKDLISIYSVKFKQSPYVVGLLKKITKILDRKNCTDSQLFFDATKNLDSLEPSAITAELMGKMYIKKENYNKAAEYLKKAINLGDDQEKIADMHYLLAVVYFQLKKFSQARDQCYETLKIRPKDGKAYILIGDLYAASAPDCGDNKLTSKVAYWAAVDKYIKAKSVDPSVAEQANSKISTYSQYFPLTEDIFFYGLKKGDTYQVECWINESTTIRSSD